ncbi:hypothetical protein [Shewanella gelidii]|uniref:Uncharacterized protein n=1 Tax=Shewanella gelidii TaxID=1642821 RepID=A0A917ND49_9GAMM|nr:hypothetical protein [Shewanella gelidii]MCL1098678.1 hypothetical protein [Shewanella gelidii]GGI86154.1 hypothetical protein GCM10009332_24320 [Shewanella gelidii]
MKLKITPFLFIAALLGTTGLAGVSNAYAETRVVPTKNMQPIERYGNHRRQQVVVDKFGERTGEGIICPCIFDKMQDMKPKDGRFAAFGYVWVCKVFDQDDFCREVERVAVDVR